MRRALVLAFAFAVALAGCRAVFGVDEAPERPDGASSTASTSGEAVSSSGTATGPTSSTGEGAASSAGGAGGAGGIGGEGATSQGPGGPGGAGGGAGGGDCSPCGGVACCHGTCEGDVCGSTTFDVGADAMRLADAGDRVGVIVIRQPQTAALQWIPKDAVDTLPARCMEAAGDDNGLGYIVGHAGDAYYSRHVPIGNGGGGGAIVRIPESCVFENFAMSTAFAGLAVRNDDLLAVVREPPAGTTDVRCLHIGGGPCSGASFSQSITDGLDVALDGTTIVWGAILAGGEGAVFTKDMVSPLTATQVPIALEVISPSMRWGLVINGGTASILDPDAGPRCDFDATGPLGLAADEDHVFLPHRDGLVICNHGLSDCVLDASPPVRDVLATSDAIYYSAAETVRRIQRPLDAYIASLPSATPCETRQ